LHQLYSSSATKDILTYPISLDILSGLVYRNQSPSISKILCTSCFRNTQILNYSCLSWCLFIWPISCLSISHS